MFALGNPRGLSRTLTSGVVSGLNRAIPSPANTLTYGAIQVIILICLLCCCGWTMAIGSRLRFLLWILFKMLWGVHADGCQHQCWQLRRRAA